ncbi:serine hydrolase [Flavobacterium sp.]|uniref:serine hydrolase n=1 Tax=Flavobacterium sp. TaxID=239 RepID=UPI00261B4519|nr:serine hydrolase [Flavobacterium sp.]
MKNHIYFLLALLFTAPCFSQISETEVDALAEKTLKAFNIPGIAIAIVKDGKIIHSKGYGVRSIKTNEKVDANTLFGIASNSKAFTTAALAILVDEGKVNWDDKVVKYIPEFKMYNDYVTQEFTIRDLLTHRSGLGLGAGDLMIWPDGSDFTAKDIIHNLQFLKPVSPFRTKFDYDNLLYAVAGKVIEKVSGKSWTDFIEQRIMQPLEMKNSAGTFLTLKDTTNVIAPHVPIDGKLKIVRRYTNQILDAAGGIYSSVNDMSQWMIMQLNKGKYGASLENKIFSEEQQREEMWQLQTIIPTTTKPPYNSHFSGYGLGWFLSDMKGYKEVTHTGGLEGIVTQTTLYPELNLGIVVLTNQQAGKGLRAITNTIKNAYLGIEYIDYVNLYAQMLKDQNAGVDQATTSVWETVNKNGKGAVDFKKYIGTYTDNWFGDITVSEKKGKLYFNSKRSPQLAGEIFYYKDNTFVVKWHNRSYDADAFMTFSENNTNIKMKAISEATDFSYDFQDLDFKLVKK